MGVKAAFDALGSLVVTGVTNLGLDDFQGVVPEYQLPALVVRLGGTGGEGMRPLGISADAGRVVVHVEHLLLVSGLGVGFSEQMFYGALTHVDNYLAAVAGDLDLGGTLAEPLAIADIYAGRLNVFDALYYGVLFRHRWVIKV